MVVSGQEACYGDRLEVGFELVKSGKKLWLLVGKQLAGEEVARGPHARFHTDNLHAGE